MNSRVVARPLTRSNILTLVATIQFGLTINNSWASAWPTRAVRIVVPYLPGGITDVVARLTAERLSAVFGQPFIVDNRAGAGGDLAPGLVARSNDDHMLLFGIPSQVVIAPLIKRLSYEPRKSLRPMARVFGGSYVLAINPALEVDNARDLLTKIHANSGAYSYGSSGMGTVNHLIMEWFKKLSGTEFVHIPYNGSRPLLLDLVANRIQLYFGNYMDLEPLARAGQVKLIAISAPQRLSYLPQIAALAETYPEFSMVFRKGYLAPVGNTH